jgi:cystathionine gamma-synthase
VSNSPTLRPSTLAAQALHWIDEASGGVGTPIQPATTFARGPDYRLVSEDHEYARDDNPTCRPAELLLARLERGHDALLFASGMAAANAVLQTLAPGDHVVAPRRMYWGLRNWLVAFCQRWDVALDLVDMAEPAHLREALRPGATRLVWLETPTNPTWEVIDIAAAAQIAHAVGAKVVVDNTVPTPVLTRPLEQGADLVMHSATKYLNGHGDVVAGALVGARDDALWQAVRMVRAKQGGILGAFEAWLLLRGMRTLFVRVERASASALAIARALDGHSKLEAVLYPGLARHPGHDVAARQMSGGFSGMLSLRVKGGAPAALAVVSRVQVFVRATSLGGVESLIEHRASIEGAGSPVPEDLLRLSVGIEDPDDLRCDLRQALDAA